jgi:uncharacterized protein YndB with AHSA1/START domain
MSGTGSSREVTLEIRIAASPATVFSLLTEPRQMVKWLAELVEADAQPGGIFRLVQNGGPTIEGIYLEVIADRKIVFTWGGVEGLKPGQSTVEILLVPDGAGTLLRLRHFNLPDPALDAHHKGWELSGLPKLKDAAEGRPLTGRCLSDMARLASGDSS